VPCRYDLHAFIIFIISSITYWNFLKPCYGGSFVVPCCPYYILKLLTCYYRLATVASGAASGKLLQYEVGGPKVCVQTAYGVEVEVGGWLFGSSVFIRLLVWYHVVLLLSCKIWLDCCTLQWKQCADKLRYRLLCENIFCIENVFKKWTGPYIFTILVYPCFLPFL